MSFSELMEKAIGDKLKDIQLGMIGKIISFDDSLMRADVDPLLKITNDLDEEEDLPVLSDLPVRFYYGGGFLIKPNYVAGDYVWLSFTTHDFDNSLLGYKRLASNKMFEIHNACVMGGIVKDNFVAPSVFSKSGIVIAEVNTGIHLRVEAAGIYASNGVTEFNILTHTHPTAGTGPPSPPTPGS